MKKLIIIMALLSTAATTDAQHRREFLRREGHCLYTTNPVGWYCNKIGAGYEYYKDHKGYVISATKYLGFYTGVQAAGEYRYYTHVGNKTENYVYGKVVVGCVHYYNYAHSLSGPLVKSGSGNTEHGELAFNIAPDDFRSATYFYGGVGAGVGKRVMLSKHLFGNLNAGLKYTPAIGLRAEDKENFKGFHILGSGSYLDVNFTVGYKF